MRDRGLTLPEALLSIFVLVSAMTLIVTLYHNSVRLTGRAERATSAVALAEKELAALREWAAVPANYDDWSPMVGGVRTDPDYPGFEVRIAAEPVTLASPSTELEAGQLDPRLMRRSFMRARVRVTWGAEGRFDLVTLVGDPYRDWDPTTPIQVNPTTVGGVLGPDASQTFSATAYDASGRPIDDLFLSWWVTPQSSNGTVTHNRPGSSATFTNAIQLRLPTGPITRYARQDGTCEVTARGVYGGLERTSGVQMTLDVP